MERVEARHGGHAAEAPGWEMAGPGPAGLWRGWRPGTEGTQQSRVVESRVVRGWLLPSWLCLAVCPRSSQMVVWLPRSALPRAVTRYVLSGLREQKAE